MREQIEAIAEQLNLSKEDNATFVVDASPGGRNVYVVLDYPNEKWAAYIRQPEEGQTILVEGVLSAAGLMVPSS